MCRIPRPRFNWCSSNCEHPNRKSNSREKNLYLECLLAISTRHKPEIDWHEHPCDRCHNPKDSRFRILGNNAPSGNIETNELRRNGFDEPAQKFIDSISLGQSRCTPDGHGSCIYSTTHLRLLEEQSAIFARSA